MKKRITVVEVDDIDVEIAIVEAIQLMPPNERRFLGGVLGL